MSARRKGAAGERELAAELRRLGFVDARKTSAMYRPGDVAPDVSGLPGCHIEVKRTEALNIHAALGQAERDCAPGELPLVCFRRNRDTWRCCCRLADLPALAIAILAALREAEQATPFTAPCPTEAADAPPWQGTVTRT